MGTLGRNLLNAVGDIYPPLTRDRSFWIYIAVCFVIAESIAIWVEFS